MTLALETDALPLQQWADGTIRVGGTRILLSIVIGAYNRGHIPEEIAIDYDVLQVADVYAVIAFYLHHKTEVDAYLEQRTEEEKVLRAEIESDPEQERIHKQLLARKQQ